MSNQYTVDILNADRLVVQGKEIDPFTLGTLVTADAANNIGIRVDAPELTLDVSGTDGIRIPRGTTAERSGIPTSNGILRYNTETNQYEAKIGSTWKNFLLTGSGGSGGGSSAVSASFLVDADSETQLELKRNRPTSTITESDMTPQGAGGPNVYGGTSYPDWRIINGYKSTEQGLYFETSFIDTQNSNAQVLKNVMFLDISGEVGIGTQDPIYTLDVSSNSTNNLRLETTQTTNWSCFQNSTRTWKLGQDGTNFVLKLDNGTSLGSVTLSNKMSVTQNGHLMLGDSTDTGGNRAISALYSDMNAGDEKFICFGKENSNGNQAILTYLYSGNSNKNNQLSLGFFNRQHILAVAFKKRIGINVNESTSSSDDIKAALHIKTADTSNPNTNTSIGGDDTYIILENWRNSNNKYGIIPGTHSDGAHLYTNNGFSFVDYTNSVKEFRGSTQYYKNIFSYSSGSPGTVTFDTKLNIVSYANLDNLDFTFFKAKKFKYQVTDKQTFQMTFKGSGGEENAVQFYTATTSSNGTTPAYIFYTDKDTSNKVTIYKNSKVRIGPDTNNTAPTEYLHVEGSIKSTSIIYSSSSSLNSDDRLKHNEVNVTNALGIINKLNIKQYFKTQELYGRNHHFSLNHLGQPINDNGELVECTTEIGIIAQEVKTISELEPFVNGEEIVNGEETSLGLDYNSIFSCGLAATQELDKKHNLLQYHHDKTNEKVSKNDNNILNNKQLIESLQQQLNTANRTIETLTQEKNALENKVKENENNINLITNTVNSLIQRLNN